MSIMFRFPFLISLTMAFFSLLGIYFGQNYLAIVLVLILHPILDRWIGRKQPIPSPLSPLFFDRLFTRSA
ncbi:MAG: hypothetical protein B7Y39_11355 [Bdellovibrio sp. 28-41-41]|nr:MAG: hypothetical protein B7Y39_11355 [Bdellovibrio sp. 28-41-41]